MNITTTPMPRAAANDAGTSSASTNTPAGLNNMFLQLLVAQLRNQNPLDPMDPTQFVGQLAQFSELSEITQIGELLRENLPAPTAQAQTEMNQSQAAAKGASSPRAESVTSPKGSTHVLNIEGLFSNGNSARIQ